MSTLLQVKPPIITLKPIVTNLIKLQTFNPDQLSQTIMINCSKLGNISPELANTLLNLHEQCKSKQGRLILFNINFTQRQQLKQSGILQQLIIATPQESQILLEKK